MRGTFAQAPYCQLQDVQLSADKSYVSCIAVRESLLHGEAHTPMAQWELLRHAANAGEFACAAVNPIKERHYYLSISIGYELTAYEGARPWWCHVSARCATATVTMLLDLVRCRPVAVPIRCQLGAALLGSVCSGRWLLDD